MPTDDFDFLCDPWLIDNVQYRAGVETRFRGEHSGIVKHMGGAVNTDVSTFFAAASGDVFRGMSLRLLDPRTDEWSIYWIDESSVRLSSPVVGSFTGTTGTFTARDEERDGALCRFLWTAVDTPTPRWEQGFSEDGGSTWTVDWTMDFRRP